jgi:hypothetical protein
VIPRIRTREEEEIMVALVDLALTIILPLILAIDATIHMNPSLVLA